jgi:predicted glycoside hydrolase/deacetylase ChbG (UPF0249 family)
MDASEIRAELVRQLAAFNRLVGRDPTHFDSHQHVHLRGPARAALATAAEEMGVPLRQVFGGVRYCGEFYGQSEDGQSRSEAITVESLIRILMLLPPGVTELACHPGMSEELRTMYREERAQELHTLCDSRVLDAIEALGVRLCSFVTMPRTLTGVEP